MQPHTLVIKKKIPFSVFATIELLLNTLRTNNQLTLLPNILKTIIHGVLILLILNQICIVNKYDITMFGY